MRSIITGLPAQCNIEFNALANISEIDDGVIILNKAVADVIEHKSLHHINGTYRLIFEVEININDTPLISAVIVCPSIAILIITGFFSHSLDDRLRQNQV